MFYTLQYKAMAKHHPSPPIYDHVHSATHLSQGSARLAITKDKKIDALCLLFYTHSPQLCPTCASFTFADIHLFKSK